MLEAVAELAFGSGRFLTSKLEYECDTRNRGLVLIAAGSTKYSFVLSRFSMSVSLLVEG